MTHPSAPTKQWLERANRLALIGRVLSGTVHDVNNALQVVSGSVELLQMPQSSPEVAGRRVQAIGVQAGRVSALLADLTAFARDTSEQIEPVSLRAIGLRALGLRNHALTKLSLTPVIEGEDVSVEANARHLLQIVLNLMVNAERALTGVPGARLALTIERVGDFGAFTVEDNGPGVSADRFSAIFEPHLGQVGLVEDLGIGLCVSRALAVQQAGTLTCAARHLGGARFSVSLPALRG
ncbi:MAG: hypothetical protein A3J29_02125 [Acidobacteria bacterium RIFCSPLOWO2_12_FULL_67_14b]|nr:MAG: hypothetical protein A3J29_02125 [Acidobacteria bacterium RIFCSPLOWO2_12_FULL_67_14b]